MGSESPVFKHQDMDSMDFIIMLNIRWRYQADIGSSPLLEWHNSIIDFDLKTKKTSSNYKPASYQLQDISIPWSHK